jgi:hypothetical protein
MVYAAIFAIAVAGVLIVPWPLAGQVAASRTAAGPGADPVGNGSASAVVSPTSLALPALLPSILVPPAASADGPVALQTGEGARPVLFAVAGGIAGMFVGRWWMQRGCDENCDERGFLGLLAGGLLGTVVGWMVGGGEMTDPGPPGRWP